MVAHVLSVNIAQELVPNPAGFQGVTGIDKRPVHGRVAVRDDHVAGDRINDRRHHGGPDQAVYAYSREDVASWAGELGRELLPGSFGENLSTEGLDVTGAVIGERWRIGTALLEVSCPRIPCQVFKNFINEDRWIKRFTERGQPGAYLRIIEPGDIGAGDAVIVTDRPSHGVTIGEAFRAFTGDRSLAPRLLLATALPAKGRATIQGWLDGVHGPLELDPD